MATNPFFSTQGYKGEQDLYEDLTIESLKIHGQEFYYLPRDANNRDALLGDDIAASFNEAYVIEMYVENPEAWEGQDLFQKFGVEIRDEATLVISKRRWRAEMNKAAPHQSLVRPREGDLVFHPTSQSVFEIMFVEHEQPFYQMNNLPVYKLNVSLFEYSGEDIDVDIEGLDKPDPNDINTIEDQGHTVLLTLDSAGAYIIGEEVTQTNGAATVTGEVVANSGTSLWVAHMKTNQAIYTAFAVGQTVVGAISGVSKTISTVEFVDHGHGQNATIETEGDGLIDTSVTGPFGSV